VNPDGAVLVAWSPNDTKIVTVCCDDVVKLWDVQTGECMHTFEKKGSQFISCAWFPDGKRFICGGHGYWIWDVEGREMPGWKELSISDISHIAVTRDGSHLVGACEDSDIFCYNFELEKERIIEEESTITSLSLSMDSRYLLVNLASQEIHLWPIKDEGRMKPFLYKGHRQGPYSVWSCFGGPDDAFIVSGSGDSQIYVWLRGTGELLEVLPGHSGAVHCVSWNPVNPFMFASASADHTIRIWNLSKFSPHSSDNVRGLSDSVIGESPEPMDE
jgi:WD40 repeat protein